LKLIWSVRAFTYRLPSNLRKADRRAKCFDPEQIVDREQLLTAIYSALQAASSGSLKTKTLHSEVLLSLHPSATVSRPILFSLQAFEAAEDEVLIIRIGHSSSNLNRTAAPNQRSTKEIRDLSNDQEPHPRPNRTSILILYNFHLDIITTFF
jgi:hypothetical protein